jgi:HEAT repeat protein
LKGASATFGLVTLAGLPLLAQTQPRQSVAALLVQFENTKLFWQQFDVAKAIVDERDAGVLPRLRPWLTHADRHLRGNAAFIFASLGDRQGFDVIVSILSDYSERPEGQGIATFPYRGWSLGQQIRADRYYAAHLLGDLRDPRAVPILVALLDDPDVNYIVPWSLGQIGGEAAIKGLIQALSNKTPSVKVLAIYAIADLNAVEALPKLRELLADSERSNFGKLESVADAARATIAKLQNETAR